MSVLMSKLRLALRQAYIRERTLRKRKIYLTTFDISKEKLTLTLSLALTSMKSRFVEAVDLIVPVFVAVGAVMIAARVWAWILWGA